jgi:hypothetical protein
MQITAAWRILLFATLASLLAIAAFSQSNNTAPVILLDQSYTCEVKTAYAQLEEAKKAVAKAESDVAARYLITNGKRTPGWESGFVFNKDFTAIVPKAGYAPPPGGWIGWTPDNSGWCYSLQGIYKCGVPCNKESTCIFYPSSEVVPSGG